MFHPFAPLLASLALSSTPAAAQGSTSPDDVVLGGRCGDGVVDLWETCDTAIHPWCRNCAPFCGNCVREPGEDPSNCPEDGALGGACNPLPEPDDPPDCDDERCDSGEAGGSDTGAGLDDDGCGCRDSSAGGAPGLALLLLFSRRRRVRGLRWRTSVKQAHGPERR